MELRTSRTGFNRYLKLKELGKRTIQQYIRHHDQLSYLIKEVGLTQELLNHFLEMHKNNIVTRAFLRNFFDYYKIKDLEIIKISGRKEKKIKKIMKPKEVNAVANYLANHGDNKLRNEIMFSITYLCGLRRDELLGIEMDDFDLEGYADNTDESCELIVRGKGKKERTVVVPPDLMERIIEYANIRLQEKIKHNFWKLRRSGWEKVFKRACKKTLGKTFSLHEIRHCVSEDTLILTLDGWKRYYELDKGEIIPNFNIEKNLIEFENVQRIFKYKYNNKILRLKNMYIDSLITPEHKIPVQICKIIEGKDIWQKSCLIKINDLLNIKSLRNIKYYLNAQKENQGISIGRAKAGLLGWILTDGYFRKRENKIEVTISQSYNTNKYKCKIISDLLKESKLNHSKKLQKIIPNKFNGKPQQMINFRIFNKNTDWIFEWINEDRTPKYRILLLKREELEEIYKHMMLGDGSYNRELCTQNKKRIDFFRALCCLIKKRTNFGFGYDDRDCGNGLIQKYQKLRTYITQRQTVQLLKSHITLEDYNGIVWCPKTRNGTFIAKRNEKIFITGNTSASHWHQIEGLDINDIKTRLGHESISTTQLYVHPDKEKVISDWKNHQKKTFK
jgi:integrase